MCTASAFSWVPALAALPTGPPTRPLPPALYVPCRYDMPQLSAITHCASHLAAGGGEGASAPERLPFTLIQVRAKWAHPPCFWPHPRHAVRLTRLRSRHWLGHSRHPRPPPPPPPNGAPGPPPPGKTPPRGGRKNHRTRGQFQRWGGRAAPCSLQAGSHQHHAPACGSHRHFPSPAAAHSTFGCTSSRPPCKPHAWQPRRLQVLCQPAVQHHRPGVGGPACGQWPPEPHPRTQLPGPSGPAQPGPPAPHPGVRPQQRRWGGVVTLVGWDGGQRGRLVSVASMGWDGGQRGRLVPVASTLNACLPSQLSAIDGLLERVLTSPSLPACLPAYVPAFSACSH